jgi:hypothetical protein
MSQSQQADGRSKKSEIGAVNTGTGNDLFGIIRELTAKFLVKPFPAVPLPVNAKSSTIKIP